METTRTSIQKIKLSQHGTEASWAQCLNSNSKFHLVRTSWLNFPQYFQSKKGAIYTSLKVETKSWLIMDRST